MSKYRERYPWLRLVNLYNGELYKNRDAMDDMLPGWDLAFGEIMCAELDAAIKEAGVEDTFVVKQLKEKFGQLRVYNNQPSNSKIALIFRKYELISAHVCVRCGKVDVPMLNAAWIRPMCEDCYTKDADKSHEAYERIASKDCIISDELIWETYEGMNKALGVVEYKKFVMNIAETVALIRDNWQKRVESGTHIVEHSELDPPKTKEEEIERMEKLRQMIMEDIG